MLEENTVQYVSAQEITKQILMIICTIIAIVFISTGIIHSLQQTSEFQITFSLDPNFDFNFDTALYYCVVTMLTIGYGDLVPDTRYTRLIISLMLIMVIVLLTSQTSSLSDLLKRSSRYVRPYKGERGGHIVVVGTYTPTTLYRFLREFYHPDHKLDMKTCKVVLIGNDAPTKELYRIINNPYYESAVFYIQGDFLTEATIKNANLPKSRGVFILSDQYTEQSNNVDTYTILASSCVKEYSPDTKVYLQLVKPDLMIHNYWAGWEIGFST
jgi:voltage-gated potassium channel Kch